MVLRKYFLTPECNFGRETSCAFSFAFSFLNNVTVTSMNEFLNVACIKMKYEHALDGNLVSRSIISSSKLWSTFKQTVHLYGNREVYIWEKQENIKYRKPRTLDLLADMTFFFLMELI